jgi:cation transport ATPase
MLSPSHVRRLDTRDPDDDGPIEKFGFDLVLPTSLAPGDLVLCAAGDMIPTDGVIVEGFASLRRDLDESSEGHVSSMLVGPGDCAVAGSRLDAGYIVLRVGLARLARPDAGSRAARRSLHGIFMRLALYFRRRERAHDSFL